MTTERWGTLGLALGAGLAAALLAFVLVRGHAVSLHNSDRTVPVVFAEQDIPPRTRLTSAMLSTRRIPQSQSLPDYLSERQDLIGRVELAAVAPGQPVLRSNIAAPDADLGMAFDVPKNRRAVTIPLDAAGGVGGFVQPGDHVDILATLETDGSSSQSETRTVLQNVPLLAVGSRTKSDTDPSEKTASSDPASATVTVAVSPADAQSLVLWANRGKLHLALRSAQDEAFSALPLLRSQPAVSLPRISARPVQISHLALPALTPLPPMPVILPLPPTSARITVIRGTQVQILTVAP